MSKSSLEIRHNAPGLRAVPQRPGVTQDTMSAGRRPCTRMRTKPSHELLPLATLSPRHRLLLHRQASRRLTRPRTMKIRAVTSPAEALTVRLTHIPFQTFEQAPG